MPTRREEAQSTTAAEGTAAATAPARPQRKKRSSGASRGGAAASRSRAASATEPKPIRRAAAATDDDESVTGAARRGVRTQAAGANGSDPVEVPVPIDETAAVDEADDAVVDDEDTTVDPEELLADVADVEEVAEAEVVEETEEAAAPEAAAVPEPTPLQAAVAAARGRPREDEEETMKLWRAYKAGPTEQLRNRLIERYLHIVKFSAERMHARLPGEVDVDDLMQAGLFGLMDSIDAFDLERGVKFETFCTARIRGAIFDELRSMDWVPRLVRARTSKVDKARKQLEAELGRKPTDDELCDRLGVDQNEFKKIIKDSSPVGVVSLDRKWFETDSSKDVREIDVIKDSKQESPVLHLQRGDLKHLITKGLSRAERLIVILYYYEGMTMKEIGTTLDLSESRVSQMHSSILARLKAQMQHRDKEF